ncbi:MAG: SGNH/GDSL hydrolase family protein [Planctomycetes bacterium]|nr:SGNH/GDSL hydrolase family protein [Planctomycetota bacterium]
MLHTVELTCSSSRVEPATRKFRGAPPPRAALPAIWRGTRLAWCHLACTAFPAGCVGIPVPRPEVRYLAFGDSATDGPADRDYPDILRQRLGETPERFANEGHGGDTSAEGLDRLRGLLDDGLYPNAQVLLLWLGGTDVIRFIRQYDPLLLRSPDDPDFPFTAELTAALDATQANIDAALELAGARSLTAYVATYFPIRSDLQSCDALFLRFIVPAQADRANVYINRLNDRIRSAAADAGATLVDIAAVTDIAADPANYHDCNHLSTAGNELVAARFADVVTPVGE